MPHPKSPYEHTLTLVQERKIRDLLPEDCPDRLEASGVVALPGGYTVVFDNLAKVAQIAPDLIGLDGASELRCVRGVKLKGGFEDIVYDQHDNRFHLLIECTPTGHNEFMAQVVECDNDFKNANLRRLPFPFLSKNPDFNKGFEGMAQSIHIFEL